VEHKIPSSKNETLHFEWTNLTMACTECNRRKNDYYKKGAEFLDPYVDDVEACLVHLGPLVYHRAGELRAEITVKILALDRLERASLIQRKCDALEKARALLELVDNATSEILRALRRDELEKMRSADGEYSVMIATYLKAAEGKPTA
jgi:hypothetical protein